MNKFIQFLVVCSFLNAQVMLASDKARGSYQALLVETPLLGYKIAVDRSGIEFPSKEKRRSSYPQTKATSVSPENRYTIPEKKPNYNTFSNIYIAVEPEKRDQNKDCCDCLHGQSDPCCATKRLMHILFPCLY